MKESAGAYFFFADQTRGRVISEFFRMVYISCGYHIPAVRAVGTVYYFFCFKSIAAFLSDIHTGRVVRSAQLIKEFILWQLRYREAVIARDYRNVVPFAENCCSCFGID